MPVSKSRRKNKERGRPLKNVYAPRVDATPEEIAKAMFALPADHEWQYEQDGGQVYQCRDCLREVNYPETLYRDGRCETCHNAPVS